MNTTLLNTPLAVMANDVLSAAVPVEQPSADYPYIEKNGNLRRPRVLILGSGTSLGATDAWARDASLSAFPDTTYVADVDTWDQTGLDDVDAVGLALDNDTSGEPTPGLVNTLLAWVAAGGGLVTTEWLMYIVARGDPTDWQALYDALPMSTTAPALAYSALQEMAVVDASAPVMRELASQYAVGAPLWASALPLCVAANGGTVVATSKLLLPAEVDSAGVATRTNGAGRMVHMNITWVGAARTTADSPMWQLWRNALWWCSGGGN